MTAFEQMFECGSQRDSENGHHNEGFDASPDLMKDRADRQFAFQSANRCFGFGQLGVFFGAFSFQIRAQQVGAFAGVAPLHHGIGFGLPFDIATGQVIEHYVEFGPKQRALTVSQMLLDFGLVRKNTIQFQPLPQFQSQKAITRLPTQFQMDLRQNHMSNFVGIDVGPLGFGWKQHQHHFAGPATTDRYID